MEIIVPHRFRPRPYQLAFLSAMDRGCKRGVQVWHRRAGKEKTDINYTVKKTVERVGSYFYFFPSYTQAKKAVWDGADRDGFRFMDHIPSELVKAKHEQELKVTLRNGSIIQLIGSDNIDAVMSTNPVGVVFAEYSLQDPRAWDYIRPILRENGGWAVFNFTPRGKNHAYALYQMALGNPEWHVSRLTIEDTGVLTAKDMEAERAEGMDEDLIQQEYYCSFEGVMQGAYYGKQLATAEKEGRITTVPYEPGVGVETWWDIGVGDSNAIWFTQSVGREVLVIDYMEASGESIAYYAKELHAKPYAYLSHNGPQDLEVREWGHAAPDGRPITRMASARAHGINFRLVPQMSIDDGISAGREFMARCRFDRTKCARGLNALASYHKTYDDKLKQFRSYPCHDWSSNGADAWRYLSVGHRMNQVKPKPKARPLYVELGNDGRTSANGAWMGV